MASQIEKDFLRLAKSVHSGELPPGSIDEAVTSFVADNLLKGVFSGFGDEFGTVDYDTPDYKQLAHLEKNVFWFSAAKNYHEVVELNEALRNGDKVLTLAEFKEKASEIHAKFNAQYLAAEYHHAIGSSQMARRWLDIQEAKETHPYLRFATVGDDRVRPKHKELHGVIKRVDDKFWDIYFPLLDWGCRCDVEQLTDGIETPDGDIVYPEIPDMFKVNTAKLGVVYPPKHPIYSIPDKHINEVLQGCDELWKTNSAAYHKVQSFRSNGSIEVHPLNSDVKDVKDNIEKFHAIAEKGSKVKILPLSDQMGVKNPDALVDGVVTEHKRLSSIKIRTVKKEVETAIDQGAKHVVLQLMNISDISDVHRALRYTFIHQGNPINQSIEKVYIMNAKGKYQLLDVDNIVKNNRAYFSLLKKVFK
jgi:SPP1 gp7 family putative phage head morphogenesis protein